MKVQMDLLLYTPQQVNSAKCRLMLDANMAPLEAPMLRHTQVRKELEGH